MKPVITTAPRIGMYSGGMWKNSCELAISLTGVRVLDQKDIRLIREATRTKD
jgi:hypothetical protein